MSHYQRVELIRQAAALKPPANLDVLGKMFEEIDSPVVQAQILGHLDFASETAGIPEFLERALRNSNSRIRANAVEALRGCKEESLRDLIRELLDDEDNRVQANACIYLWSFEDERESVRTLLETMAASRDRWVRASAIFAFGKILDPAFDSLLEKALDDDYEPSVVAAVQALTQRRLTGFLPRLLSFLKDEERGTPLWTASVASLREFEVRGPDVVRALICALSLSGARELQDGIMEALADQGGTDVAVQVLEFLETRDADYHLCQRLLDVVALHGQQKDRPRLRKLAQEKLAMYSDIIERVARDIGRRKSWWK